MESVICSCLRCQAWIGTFENLWDRIGKTYYSPIFITEELGGLVTVGEVREAAKTGVIENSSLQDLACKGCGEILGLRCYDAPASHVLTKNQLILRIGGMKIVSEEAGEHAILRVRRKFSLTGPQSSLSDRQEDREQPISLASNNEAAEHISRPSGGDVAAPSSGSDPLPGLIRFAEWAEDAINAQRKDISRISTVVTKIEKDMRSFKDFMVETRKDLLTLPTEKPWVGMKRSVTILGEEVDAIRKELEAGPRVASLNDDESVKMSVEELDVLTSSITKISQKVNEVESLKIELQFMKSRLKRFEDASRMAKQTAEPLLDESLTTQDISSNPSPPLLQRGTRGVAKPVANGSMLGAPLDSNSNRKSVQRVVPEARTERDYGKTPVSESSIRKRRSEEYESDLALETLPASAVNSQKKGKPFDPTLKNPNHDSYWKIDHRPRRSLLSNVQHVDDIPNLFESDQASNAAKFTDGSYSSESEHRRPLQRTREREYDSAPESGPARRKGRPVTQGSNTRQSSSPEELSPPRTASHQPKRRRRRATTTPRRRLRARPIARFNEDGVRITKKGVPDRRPGNYVFLQRYWDKRLAQKALEQKEGEEQGQEEGGVGRDEDRDEGDATLSIEAASKPAINSLAEERIRREKDDERREAVKRAELEARDRLVRDTLERELAT